MNKHKVYSDLKENYEIYIDESMKKHTSFKTGGNADILVKPKSVEEIINLINYFKQNDIEYIVIGNGTNLLVKDSGIRKAVIKIGKSFGSYKVEGEYITASSGMPVIALSKFATENSLSGLEFASGIPGTLGGALKMNAGCFKGQMSDLVYSTKYINEKGEICEIINEEHKFGYRTSIFHENNKLIILESTLKLTKGNIDEIKEKVEYNNNYRREKQPINYPSAGSTFKRPEGHFPGKLIEDCGLKGYTIGGAQVSELHANFIINIGDATSKDILDLAKYVQDKVFEEFNVKLELEIEIVGED